MDIGTVKIILQIISQFDLSDHVFLPVNKKLASINAYDILKDAKLNNLVNNPILNKKMESIELHGIALPKHSKKFLSWQEGKNVIEYLINESTAKDRVDLEKLIITSYGNVKDGGF